MITTLWAVTGGAGTTVVAGALGAALAGRGVPTLLVDLAGDLPAALGLAEPAGPGVTDWLDSDGAAAAIGRLSVPVRDGLDVLPAGGSRSWPAGRVERLAAAVAERPGAVVVDGGRWSGPGPATRPGPPGPDGRLGAEATARRLAAAGRSVLVTRPCFLSLRRAAARRPLGVDGVVLVEDHGRSLGPADVASVLGAPVIARVPVDPAVARAVDAGVLAARLPRALGASLRSVA